MHANERLLAAGATMRWPATYRNPDSLALLSPLLSSLPISVTTPSVSGTQFHVGLLVAEGGDRVEVHGAEGGKDASRQGGKE